MRRGVVLFCFLLTGCSGVISPGEQRAIARDAVAIPTPSIARQTWNELEACSGLRGNFDAVRWLVEPNGIRVDGAWRGGAWIADWNAIVLAPPNQTDPFIIRHEEMHALLHGGSDHPAKYFNGACGDLMTPH